MANSFWSVLGSTRRLARIPLLCVAASLIAAVLPQQGLLQRLEIALSDHVSFSSSITPRNDLFLVATDEETIRQTGKYPYDRVLLARAIERLNDGGVRRVYLDAGLNYSEDAAGDDELERALQRLGPQRLALPASRISGAASSPHLTRPLERFARHATVVTTDFVYDTDRRVRWVRGLPDQDLQLAASWLAGKPAQTADGSVRINYSIDAQQLKHANLIDVAEGRFSPHEIRGRVAVLGLQITASQYRITVPRYGYLSRLDLLALTGESLAAGFSASALPGGAAFLLTLGVALAFATMILRMNTLFAFAAWALIVCGWFGNADRLQVMTGYTLPMLAPPLAALIVWQGVKFRDSALARWLSRLWMRFAGVGKNSLVAAMDVMADAALIYDLEGRIIGQNDAFHGFRNLFAEKLGNQRSARLADFFPTLAKDLLERSGDGHTRRLDLALDAPDGEQRHFEIGVRWVETMSGPLAIASLKDVTEARDRELSLARLAFKDNLTGLANRMSLVARLTRMGEENAEFAVLLIDLDGFKQVNDTLGHHAGDQLLVGVARRIEKLLRPQDLAARLGGDEFAVLLATGEEAGAAMVATRLLKSLRDPFNIDNAIACVGASVGIALGPAHHSDPMEVLKLADAAMYEAKKVKPAYAVHRPRAAAAVTKLAA